MNIRITYFLLQMTTFELNEHMKSKLNNHFGILASPLQCPKKLEGASPFRKAFSSQCEKQQQLCLSVNKTQLMKLAKDRNELEEKIRIERAVNVALCKRNLSLKSQLAGDFHAKKADNGNIRIEISQVNQKIVESLTEKGKTFSSQPFFLERCRYKVRLNVRFDLINNEPSMSLNFMIIKGEFDSKLQWPFPNQIMFKVINKTGGGDIIRSLGSQDSPTCAKPDTDKNIVYGCPNIASQAELMNGYITQDDSVFVECEINVHDV